MAPNAMNIRNKACSRSASGVALTLFHNDFEMSDITCLIQTIQI